MWVGGVRADPVEPGFKRWKVTLSLSDGLHDLQLRVRQQDHGGVQVVGTFQLLVDTEGPTIVLRSPVPKTVFEASTSM